MLRHAYGFALADQGADTRLIQDYLGHRSIQHTVRYTATNPVRFEKLWRCTEAPLNATSRIRHFPPFRGIGRCGWNLRSLPRFVWGRVRHRKRTHAVSVSFTPAKLFRSKSPQSEHRHPRVVLFLKGSYRTKSLMRKYALRAKRKQRHPRNLWLRSTTAAKFNSNIRLRRLRTGFQSSALP